MYTARTHVQLLIRRGLWVRRRLTADLTDAGVSEERRAKLRASGQQQDEYRSVSTSFLSIEERRFGTLVRTTS